MLPDLDGIMQQSEKKVKQELIERFTLFCVNMLILGDGRQVRKKKEWAWRHALPPKTKKKIK